MTQDGYDWPNNVQDERWPADKYQPAAPYFREMLGLRKQPGQGYRVEPNEALCDAATRAFNLRE
jgi:hypothetical protein